MTVLFGIDFGGTTIKLGVVEESGVVQARATVPFDRSLPFDALAGAVADRLDALARETGMRAEAIGISTPGYADPETGVLVDGVNNVPALGGGRSLTTFFRERFGLPATIDNDGTCAAMAELRFGAGRGLSRFVVLTLGTGVGGGVIVDGRPVLGAKRIPPELGALCLDPDGPVNYSGIPGTFERLAAAASMIERFRQAGGTVAETAADVFARAAEGDPAGVTAVDGTARVIAQACGIMVNLLNLEACILGGGLSAAGSALLDPVRAHLARYAWPFLHRNVKVLLAEQGNDAGIIGAAAFARDRARVR